MEPLDERNGGDEAAALARTLDLMWKKFVPDILDRARVLEDAAEAAAAGRLTPAERKAAQAAAHKLAGTLGTFGLGRGTDLARELEQIYSGPGEIPVDRVTRTATEIHSIIESRK